MSLSTECAAALLSFRYASFRSLALTNAVGGQDNPFQRGERFSNVCMMAIKYWMVFFSMELVTQTFQSVKMATLVYRIHMYNFDVKVDMQFSQQSFYLRGSETSLALKNNEWNLLKIELQRSWMKRNHRVIILINRSGNLLSFVFILLTVDLGSGFMIHDHSD